LFSEIALATLIERLTDMLTPAVEAAGFELWGVEFVRAGKHSTLRLYIDHGNGINVDDCALVSRQVGAVLDVEDPINTEYNLEVSSPGMDRTVFSLSQFESFVGQEIFVQLQVPVDNRRKFTGLLKQVEGNRLQFEVEHQSFSVDFAQIKKANLVPVFE